MVQKSFRAIDLKLEGSEEYNDNNAFVKCFSLTEDQIKSAQLNNKIQNSEINIDNYWSSSEDSDSCLKLLSTFFGLQSLLQKHKTESR